MGPSDSVYHSEQIIPCLERLKNLEKMVEELKTKRAQLPVKKEQMLENSMDRIKSVELDLDKTKKVSLSYIRINFSRRSLIYNCLT